VIILNVNIKKGVVKMENKVVAKVNGLEITENEVNMLIQQLGPQRAAQFKSEEGKKAIINELINQKLFYLEALDNNIENNEEFKSELEKAKMNIITQIAVQNFLEDVNVEDEEVKEYYEKNKEMFKNPEMVKASHILVSDEDKAKEIFEEISNGLDFAEAAVKYSTCPSGKNGGDLGFFGKGQMVKEFEDAAFEQNLNEVGNPVKTQFGYHIIMVTDKKEPAVSSYEEVKPELKRQMTAMKQNKLYADKTEELKKIYKTEII